jgi:large subunit ribosomal protein L25
LPPDVTINADPELLLVHVVMRAKEAEPAPEAVAETPSQPEVIKPERKEKEKED